MRALIGLATAVLWTIASAAHAYIDVTPSLGRLIKESDRIVALRVEKVIREKQAVVYKRVSDLKGKPAADTLKHLLTDDRLLDWAEEGKTAVAFMAPGGPCLVCMGYSWYECHPQQDSWWRMSLARPELALAYTGPATKLRGAVETILAGREAVITTTVHGAANQAMTFEIAFNQTRGDASHPLQRIRASLRMPDQVYLIGTAPPFFVGLGAAGAEDVPRIVESLRSPDRFVRIEAADELLSLADAPARGEAAGAVARPAVPALATALGDADAAVRLHAAAALVRIEAGHPKALAAMLKGLRDKDAAVRKAAAQCLGRAGRAAKTAVPALIEAMQDPDVEVRRAAIESLGDIGPDAGAAVAPLVKAMKDPQTRCAAAEALGPLGAKARPAAAALAEALKDPNERFRWAAAQSMVQIGGPEVKAVVPFLVQAIEKASGRDFYDLTLYLGILGPEAKEALPALERLRTRDRELTAMAIWGIQPQDKFPWDLGYTNDRPCDLWLFLAYVRHVGDRAKAAAATLAGRLAGGTAGPMPSWGYHLLIEEPDAAVPVLVKALRDGNSKTRACAAAALGKMGPAAQKATEALEAAAKDPDLSVRDAAARSLKQVRQ